MSFRRTVLSAVIVTMLFVPLHILRADDEIRAITFPTDPTLDFSDDYGDPRSGHAHEGIDILGPKMTPLYAAVDGRVASIQDPEASWGYAIVLRDADGYTYHYLHVNNDTPGTDDGMGGTAHAYAPGIVRGVHVDKGQLVGWMGDSGNAENITSHLHFEIRKPDGTSIDPYPSLIQSLYPGSYSAADALAAAPDINTDKGFFAVEGTTSPCTSGTLIKSKAFSAVYYCGADGKRHAFPNDRIYFTWYANFNTVKTISDAELAAVPLGKNVTYRPGSKMVKLESIPNVYAIEKGGILRWIKSPEIAASIYGSTWSKKVDDISDAFFLDYTIGPEITSVRPQ